MSFILAKPVKGMFPNILKLTLFEFRDSNLYPIIGYSK